MLSLEKRIYSLNEKYSILMNVEESDKRRFQSIIDWTGEMFDLSVKEKFSKDLYPKRGEVWTCQLGENVGSEVNKIRPCIIVQNDIGNKNSPTTIIIPISHREGRQPTHVSLSEDLFQFIENHISGTSLAEQIKAISKARLGRCIGVLSEDAMLKIDGALKVSLALCC